MKVKFFVKRKFLIMTNFEKYSKEIINMTEDSNLYAAIYDLKCLMGNKKQRDDEFFYDLFTWLSKECEDEKSL